MNLAIDECGQCPHIRDEHSYAREEDFRCQVSGCGCNGFSDSVVSAEEALKDAPDVPPKDDATSAEGDWVKSAGAPGGRIERDSAHVSKLEHHNELAKVEERLTAMLFLMCRDVMPVGHVGQLVESVSGDDFDFQKSELEPLARRMARGLMGAKMALREKHVRDWVDRMPERIRESKHLPDVLESLEKSAQMSGEVVRYDDRQAANVRDEVIRRQRRDRGGDLVRVTPEKVVGGHADQ